MYRSIMVPLDGSAFSEYALPLAISIARRTGATVQLALVHRAPSPLYDATGLPSLDDRMDAETWEHERSYLTNLAQRLAMAWDLKVTTTLLDEAEPVAEVLHHHALASGVDLIVMTTHGRGAVLRALLGSVADALVREASIPVLLVRPHPEARGFLDLEREQTIKRILIPLDGSALGEDILEPALSLGKAVRAECTLLQVVTPIGTDDALDTLVIRHDQQMLARRQTEAQAYLEHVAKWVRAHGLAVRTRVLVGPVTETILTYSRRHSVDLIAMSTHGDKGLTRLLVGSVAEQAVRQTTTPLLLHRADRAVLQRDITPKRERYVPHYEAELLEVQA